MSLCENCPELAECKKALLKHYKFNDGTEYEGCKSQGKSMKVKP